MTSLKELGLEHKFANVFAVTTLDDGHIGLTPSMLINNRKTPLETIWMTTEVFMSLKDLFIKLSERIRDQGVTQ